MYGSTFGAVRDLPALPDTDWVLGGAGNLDFDGEVDLVWRNGATAQNALWLRSGETTRPARTPCGSMNGTTLRAIVDPPALTNLSFVLDGPR